jgi:hypothetical protein
VSSFYDNVRSIEVGQGDGWDRGIAINNARRHQLPSQVLFLYYDGQRYATVLAKDLQDAMDFGRSWGLKVDRFALEEISPFRYPKRKPWTLRMKQKLYNLKAKLFPTKMDEDNYG